jgi:protocatechuate 3,4-dioxygenase beta subunit
MRHTTRRQFLAAGLAVSGASLWTRRVLGGQKGLEKFLVAAPPCKPEDLTPAVPAGPDYKPKAPSRTSLLESGVTGKKMTVAGYVIGLTCGRVKGAQVEFWQADANGAYDARGFRLRGTQLTDADGHYTLETIVPGPVGGSARHLCARVTAPGKPALDTRLYFPDDLATAKDKQFAPKLAMKPAGGPDAYAFDFVLNI